MSYVNIKSMNENVTKEKKVVRPGKVAYFSG